MIEYAAYCCYCVFFNDTATTEIYTLSLHDALPISLKESTQNHGPFALARIKVSAWSESQRVSPVVGTPVSPQVPSMFARIVGLWALANETQRSHPAGT